MNKTRLRLASLMTLGGFAFFIGCGGSQPSTTPSPQSSGGSSTEHAHDHGDSHEGHSHQEHAHQGAGPHDGTLADWNGGKYHVEFTVDHDKQKATVYVLGEDGKTGLPIEAEEIQLSIKDPEMQVTLKAAPQESDPKGSASRFVGNHESLGVVQEYAGSISGEIDGTAFTGDFKEEPHGHEE